MTQTTVTRTIEAPIDLIFKTISDINNFSKVVPDIVKVEFISDILNQVSHSFSRDSPDE